MKKPFRGPSTAAPFSTENLDAVIELTLDNGCSFNYSQKRRSSIIRESTVHFNRYVNSAFSAVSTFLPIYRRAAENAEDAQRRIVQLNQYL